MQWAFDSYETIVANDRAVGDRAGAPLRAGSRDDGPRPAAAARRSGGRASSCSRRLHALAPDTKVIVLTGQNDRANALKAISARVRTTSAPSRSSPSCWRGRSIARSACTSCRRRIARLQSLQRVAGHVGRHHARPRDAAHLPHDREGRADIGHGADPRRIGHRQGAARARAARPVAAARPSVSSRSIARRSRKRCSKASCSATRRARSPAPPSRRSARSRPRTAARCSSTRSATCRWRCRRSCCASCRSA